MRAPSRSFKDDLEAFRRIVEGMPALGKRELAFAVLDRWMDHGQRDDIWTDITSSSIANSTAPVSASEFIEWIVFTRLGYEQLGDVIKQVPDVYSKLRTQAERDWKADDICHAFVKRKAVKDHAARMDVVLGRKKAGAPRMRFMRMLSDTFIANCGRPLDNVVRALTEIAFDTEETLPKVRGAAKRHK
jgi:hypothetical protein